jgi:hypothetical protein
MRHIRTLVPVLLLVSGVARAQSTRVTDQATTSDGPTPEPEPSSVDAPVGSEPLPAAPAFEPQGDARARPEVISYASTRRTGFWFLGIMGTVGITSTTIGMFQTCVDDQNCQEWTSLAIWGGIAVTTAGVLIGLPMIMKADEATLTLVPGTAPLANRTSHPLPDSEQASAVPAGATLVGQF